MRLINTVTLQLEDFRRQKLPKYAILSHRWQTPTEELSFTDYISGIKRTAGGWAKIVDTCTVALSQDIQYCWIDTCCINKDSSAEESKSINSMFSWYSNASKAYVYLDDVHCPSLGDEDSVTEFSNSRWFTRGWTLQELLAPSDVVFYNSSWEALGSKITLANHLESITSIPGHVLKGETSLSECSIAMRMYWAADRITTEPEDLAYCLMGIFDVNMPLLYGEGEKAFIRLQEEILQRSTDQTIFAWSSDDPYKGVLAPSPSCFRTKYSQGLRQVLDYFPDDPASDSFSLGNAGLSIEFVLIPWAMNTYLAPLRCFATGLSCGSDPTQRLCLILRRTRIDHRFIRVSMHDSDLVLHRYLRVPKDPNTSYWDRSRLHRRILIARSPLMMVKDCMYGFQFNFWSPSLFDTGSKPDPKDVVSENPWDKHRPQLQVKHGAYRTAGIFRMTGPKIKSSMMIFGFDADFNPFCYIAWPPFELLKQRLPLLNIKRDIAQPEDLQAMSIWERSSWLDGMYLHKLIDEVVKIARSQPGDWSDNCIQLGLLLGDRNITEQAFDIPKFKFRVILKLVGSSPLQHWRFTLKDID